MASDRGKLVLDEQSFQGLLAAAFTIQQHTTRNAAANAAAADKAPTPPASTESQVNANAAKPSIAICSRCGVALSPTDAACPKCGAGGMRPGERLQRNWASLWQMSQEQGMPLDGRRRHEDDFPLSPADPGRPRSAPASSGSGTPSAPLPSATAPSIPAPVLHSESQPAGAEAVAEIPSADAELPSHSDEHGAASYQAAGGGQPDAGIESVGRASERMEAEGGEERAEREELMPSWNQAPTETYRRENEEAWSEPETVEASGGRLQSMRLKVRLHRADVFLALAVIVAGAALLWPVAGRSHDRPLWERMLIAAGLAEAPPQAVHFRGDPDLKVWVDTHTALYYCPGDELYGKSPNGHYTTQREAQADRFEPAERSVCIQ